MATSSYPSGKRPTSGKHHGGSGHGAPGHGAPGHGAPGAEFIYGRNPVREALLGRRRMWNVLLVTGRVGDELEAQVRDWSRAAGLREPVPVQRVPFAQLAETAGSGDHQGVAARVDPYPYLRLEDVLRSHTLMVALDSVQDPHNLGAIVRTAEAVGAAVVIPRHRAAEVTAAVVKSSAGATEHAAVVQVRNLADALSEVKEAGFWVYGASAEAESSYSTQDYRYPTCFVLGSEGQGVGRRVASACDVMVSLPLAGRVDSLNVSVTAGILVYEAVRQRGQGGGGTEIADATRRGAAEPDAGGRGS